MDKMCLLNKYQKQYYYQTMKHNFGNYGYQLLLFYLIFGLISSKCSYRVYPNGKPFKVDEQPHLISGLTQCVQYNGKMGCCDQNNDRTQITSYMEIDGVFGSAGDACDLCAINLKRFWCEYACSPNQAGFLQVGEGMVPVPDPQKPGKMILVQKVQLTVEAQTACDLYNSCKRVSFVTSVSAMGSPAGFLTFQGHNAVDDAFQYIDTDFSYQKNNSLYFMDGEQEERKALQPCNYKTNNDTIHGFPFFKNCTCNNCEESCDNSSGFQYYNAGVLEDFNWILVSGVWGGVIVLTLLLTFIRRSWQNKLKDN